MSISGLLGILFPHLARLRITRVFHTGRSVRIQASTHDPQVACPACGVHAQRVHSRYERRISDTAVAGRELLIHLSVRRFFCGNAACPVERLAGLIQQPGREQQVVGGAGRPVQAHARAGRADLYCRAGAQCHPRGRAVEWLILGGAHLTVVGGRPPDGLRGVVDQDVQMAEALGNGAQQPGHP